jgi:NDP-sugar pyrophosphorylase family protein
MNLADMTAFHEKRRGTCTIAMSTSVPMEYGVARVDEDGRVTYFEEKPIIKEYPVSMGILICEKEVLRYCKPNTDISHEVVPQLLRDKKPVFAYLTSKRHYDIGTFKNLEETRTLVEQSKAPFIFS